MVWVDGWSWRTCSTKYITGFSSLSKCIIKVLCFELSSLLCNSFFVKLRFDRQPSWTRICQSSITSMYNVSIREIKAFYFDLNKTFYKKKVGTNLPDNATPATSNIMLGCFNTSVLPADDSALSVNGPSIRREKNYKAYLV